ncbi:AAA family ATPase [Rhodanobacter sp. MP7CTX1]|uniref:AAA family ATPase n=1 Tax=Rhodanobacter sp. MP7CTX1 TaxID=2723084 RepID=UPI001611ED32|nr:AAA family ATPase [Rhodanobacter sp. MP7CTX1]MBB6186672.1 hypothetical protein [Rhodanobacter sp. MP7CTX1]
MNRQPIIPHPAFVRARDALVRALDTDQRGQIIFVIGLSGSGKSEIRYEAMQAFAGALDQWPDGQMPAIALRAAPTDRSRFSPKEFMTRFYLELHEPDLRWLTGRNVINDPDLVHRRADARLSDAFWIDMRRRTTEHQLRTYVERMIPARGVRGVFVEEAASLTYTHTSKDPENHMVNYMCLAEEIGITLVLFGVPRAAKLWEGNAEILRRSRFVYVERYRLKNAEDCVNFERLAVSLAQRFTFSRRNLLRRNFDLAYVSSAGVCGELKSYLLRADDLRASDGAESITLVHLEGAVQPEAVLKTLHADAVEFDVLRTPANSSTIKRILK